MIIPRKPLSLMYCQACGGRSPSAYVSQSGAIRHSSSASPSRNACSSADSAGFGNASSFDQSGLPEKRSPSHHTVPALIAVASVSDIGGITLRKTARTRLLTSARRSGGGGEDRGDRRERGE